MQRELLSQQQQQVFRQSLRIHVHVHVHDVHVHVVHVHDVHVHDVHVLKRSLRIQEEVLSTWPCCS